ncbi:butyrate kinase [Alkalibaculum sp. M08DMB]|uniref:Probable butyrate kinase n=1 Tax=Alkalibaculum sporogenes TaxID=2655001 RepID=A0A6A7K8B4_9FIRM|nr:butyrate kinase [Alkalibaculum sporogenes]MPW25690.1 butyrate kinase [Alkalibaculum sporogenes]
MSKLLIINPGSTSTKIAVYNDTVQELVVNIEHKIEELEKYSNTISQYHMRKNSIIQELNQRGYKLMDFNAITGRGGMLPSVKSGAYVVNETMVDRLKNNPTYEHASNLGAILAYEISKYIGVNAYIYDSVRVDEMNDVARISGMPEIPRTSTCHALNSRAMAMKVAQKYEKRYKDLNFVVAHLGGGISLSVHEKGKIVDIMADDEGPFSPERAGRVPCKDLIDLCYSGKYDKETIHKKLRGNGGLKAYLNTSDAREVEILIKNGNEKARLVYEAMAYQISKGIGDMATVLSGEVDYIVITGGIAYSEMLTNWILNRVKYISKVEIMPGENEMESLALGTIRVLRGEEQAKEYIEI